MQRLERDTSAKMAVRISTASAHRGELSPERIASETKTIRKLGERTNERPSERNGIVVHASRLSARRFMRPLLVGWNCPVSSCRPVVQRRRGACWDAGTRRLALSGEPTSKKRAVADEVVEKSQLSCLILPINTGSELFSRVGCWDAGTRRFSAVR